MTISDVLVEGEPAELLLEAIMSLMENSEEADGMTRFGGKLGGDSGAALIHALGRITAELRADDMRSFLPGRTRSKRTEEQRGADAFILLVDRLEEALTARRGR
ncbi:DUF222 domain-containing protein [Microbacterium schleiferi]|uniref:DUF222 domain-containing protein n=1 Tax=Microbacterium schleiferi TaxID=69362 RepID=A0A7S8MW33_9MICO|nr:DUF222 domain-containing protein [Microbacterium schleiferi]QPE04279.1 DUF222 domain-containing protein [Microbacterium schleiferi]